MESHQNQFFCDTCQVTLNSKTQLDCHMNGQQHSRVIKNLQLSFSDPDIIVVSKNVYRCTVCDISVNGPVPLQDHVNGIVHFNKKKRQNNKIIFDDEIVIKSNNEYFCKTCGISCSGDIPMQNHVNGILHAKKISHKVAATEGGRNNTKNF